MRLTSKILSFFLLVALPVAAYGQKTLSLQECISVAVENNLSVKISGNELEIAKNNVNLSPFLPSLSIALDQSKRSENQRNLSQDGSREKSTVNSDSYSGSASLEWTLFDGFKMFATQEKQKELMAQGEFNFRSVVENLVMKLSTQYYLIISLQNQIKLLTEGVGISQTRYNQALTKYRIGKDSGLEYKQAKIYLNSDSSKLLLQRENLKNAYIELFRQMNLPMDSKCIISDTIVPETLLDLGNLLESGMKSNTGILACESGEKLANLDVKIAKSSQYPALGFSAGYGYDLSKNSYFPSEFDKAGGYNFGFRLSLPLFDAGQLRRKVRNAKLTLENASLDYELSKKNLESDLRQLYNIYTNNLRLIEFEKENKEAAWLNLDAALEKYRLGALSGIEFRDIQLSYMDASDRMLNAIYDAKISEINLHLLAGDLFRQK